MAVIDMHAHAFPDKLARRAIEALESECPWKAVGDGTLKGLLAAMDDSDVDVAALCMIATRPEQADPIFSWCRKKRSDRIEPMPSVHPDDPDAARWIERIAEAGFVGIKIHPMYQNAPADDSRLDPVYAACAETGLLVTLHCGLDIAYPPDDDRASPERLARVQDRFPKLRMLCTHMGGWRAWDEVDRVLVGRDVFLETSFSLGPRGGEPEQIVDMIRRHGVERVLFGSDWPWSTQREEMDRLRGLGLNEEELRRILWSNAAGLLGY